MKNSQPTFLRHNNDKKTPHWPWGLWSLTQKFNGLSKPLTAELKLENQFHLLLLLLQMTSWSIWKDVFSSTAWGKIVSTERKTTWAAHTAPARASPLPSGFIEMCIPGRKLHLISLPLSDSLCLSFYVTHTHKMQHIHTKLKYQYSGKHHLYLYLCLNNGNFCFKFFFLFFSWLSYKLIIGCQGLRLNLPLWQLIRHQLSYWPSLP